MNDKLLHKYLNNEISPEELQQLKESEVYRDYLKIAEATKDLEAPVYQDERVWQKIRSATHNKPKVISLQWKSLLKYAAVLAVIISALLFFNTGIETVEAGIAEQKSFTLPDQSEVVLNADSKISYNEKKWNKNRSLNLEGEAYFKVAKGKTFKVETPLGTVTVLGTRFNVQSRQNHFHVSCYEGIVTVNFDNINIQLTEGNSVIIEAGKVVAQPFISASQPGWMFQESTFENSNIRLVLDELKRQYNIQVNLNNVDETLRFTGAFTHNNLESALKTICLPLQLNYSVDDQGNVTIYGQQ
jgi:transmembrane sensor